MSERYPAFGACRQLSPLEPEPERERREEAEMDAREELAESIPAFGEGFEKDAREREAELAKQLREQEPERWSDYEGADHIRRARRKDREEDGRYGP